MASSPAMRLGVSGRPSPAETGRLTPPCSCTRTGHGLEGVYPAGTSTWVSITVPSLVVRRIVDSPAFAAA